jgi:hypothetical protein
MEKYILEKGKELQKRIVVLECHIDNIVEFTKDFDNIRLRIVSTSRGGAIEMRNCNMPIPLRSFLDYYVRNLREKIAAMEVEIEAL